MTDADGTYPAEFMHQLLVELEDCDMAVGQQVGKRGSTSPGRGGLQSGSCGRWRSTWPRNRSRT